MAPSNHRHAAGLRAAGMAAAFTIGFLGTARAEPNQIAVAGDRTFPESVTSTADGTLFVGSFADGGVLRALPGAERAEPWIKPGANESRSILGVLADEKSNTLWACSNDTSGFGVPGPSTVKGAALKAFDLKSGAPKGSIPFPDEVSLCNDIVVASDGTAYVTDSFNPHILKLAPGAKAFEVWATDPRFAPAPKGAGLDGIAIGADGAIYVDTFSSAALFKVAMADGKAGAVTQLATSRKIILADALRTFGAHSFLMIEGNGSLDLVTVDGTKADIKTLKDGFIGPVSVTQVGNVGWVAEGQLDWLLDPKHKDQKPKLPFHLYSVALPTP